MWGLSAISRRAARTSPRCESSVSARMRARRWPQERPSARQRGRLAKPPTYQHLGWVKTQWFDRLNRPPVLFHRFLHPCPGFAIRATLSLSCSDSTDGKAGARMKMRKKDGNPASRSYAPVFTSPPASSFLHSGAYPFRAPFQEFPGFSRAPPPRNSFPGRLFRRHLPSICPVAEKSPCEKAPHRLS